MRTIPLITALIIFIVTFPVLGQIKGNKDTLHIPEGKVGLVGFGSLMSKASMEESLGYDYPGKLINIHLDGFERVWNHGVSNDSVFYRFPRYFLQNKDTVIPRYFVFLNIQENEKKTLNARLFIIDSLDLIKFDEREFHHSKINVTHNIREFEISNGDVYAYKVLPENTITVTNNIADNIIIKDYVNLIEEVLESQGENFKDEYYQSTVNYPPNIVIDEKDLKSTYVTSKKAISVNQDLLQKYIGTYLIGEDFKMIIIIEDEKLMLQVAENYKMELFAETPNKFFTKLSDYPWFEFIESEKNGFDTVIIHDKGRKDVGRRID